MPVTMTLISGGSGFLEVSDIVHEDEGDDHPDDERGGHLEQSPAEILHMLQEGLLDIAVV